VKMRGQTKTETVSGHHYAKSKVRESPWQNSERIWRTTRSHDGIGDSKGIWRFPKQVVRLVQEISMIDGISKISVREDGIDVFFVKKIQQKTLCPKQHESTERLDLMQRAFENEGLESMVLKTWTPPKQSAPKRKWKRFHRRLCDGMERELENRQKISSAEEAVETSGEEETVEPSGEGDERLCDDVESLKSCLVKANLSAELKSLSVETPSLNCVEKTETEKLSEEGHEDPCDDGSGYNDESLETESELWRGSEEQPVRQEDFVQQLAKQEAAPEASEQNVAEEDDEQGNNVIKGDTGHVNAVSDDTQNICEAPEAEMTTQSEKEGKIVIAVEEKTLQGSVQGGSAIAAEIFESKSAALQNLEIMINMLLEKQKSDALEKQKSSV